MHHNAPEDPPVVLFDGVCHFCNGAVQFLLRHDRRAVLRFAAYQSEAGGSIARKHGIDPEKLDTFAFIDHGRAYVRSDAGIAVAAALGGPWRLALIFKLVPRVLRDALYGFIARHRYRWFGRSESCTVPDAAKRRRFL